MDYEYVPGEMFGLVGQGLMVHLTHDEVEEVCNAAAPISALVGLVAAVSSEPITGALAAVGSQVLVYQLKTVNKRCGNQGARIFFPNNPLGLLNPLPHSPVPRIYPPE